MGCFHVWLRSKMAEVSGSTLPFLLLMNDVSVLSSSLFLCIYFLAKSFILYSFPTPHKALYSVIHSLLVSTFLFITFPLLVHPPSVNPGLSLAHLLLLTLLSYLFKMFSTEMIQTLRCYNKEIEKIMSLHCLPSFISAALDTVVHFLLFKTLGC